MHVYVLSHFSHVRFFATLWTVACQDPWDFPGKNIGVGCHALLQGNLSDPGIEPVSLMSPALEGRFFTTEPPGKSLSHYKDLLKKETYSYSITYSASVNCNKGSGKTEVNGVKCVGKTVVKVMDHWKDQEVIKPGYD